MPSLMPVRLPQRFKKWIC